MCHLKNVMVKYLVCKLTHLIHIKNLLGPNRIRHMTTFLINQPHGRNHAFHSNPMTQCILTRNFPSYQTASPSGFMFVHPNTHDQMLMTTGLILMPSGSSIMIHRRAPLAVGLSPHYQVVPPLSNWAFCPDYVNFREKVGESGSSSGNVHIAACWDWLLYKWWLLRKQKQMKSLFTRRLLQSHNVVISKGVNGRDIEWLFNCTEQSDILEIKYALLLMLGCK